MMTLILTASILIIFLMEHVCTASFTQQRQVIPFRKSIYASDARGLEQIQLFSLKPSENGLTMSKTKMKFLINKGELDLFEEGGDGVESCMVTNTVKSKTRKETKKLQNKGRRASGDSNSVSSSANDYIKKLESRPALVLNADYQPLSFIPLSLMCWQDSVKAVFSGRVTVVDTYPDVTVRGISMEIPLPSVIALNEFIPKASKAIPAFTRRNVFLRDGYKCQYCNKMFKGHELSLDHVVPRSRGGILRWENTVSACRKCNGRKSDLMPSELNKIGMRLMNEPKTPTNYELNQKAGRILIPRNVHPTWVPYLGLHVGWRHSSRPKNGSYTNDNEAIL